MDHCGTWGLTIWGVAALAVPLAHCEKGRAERAGDFLEEGREELVVGDNLPFQRIGPFISWY